MEPQPEPQQQQQEATVDPRALFSLCETHGFARDAAAAALRSTSGGLDDALAALLSLLTSWPQQPEASEADEETREEELEVLDAIYGDAFSRPTVRRVEIRLERDDDDRRSASRSACWRAPAIQQRRRWWRWWRWWRRAAPQRPTCG